MKGAGPWWLAVLVGCLVGAGLAGGMAWQWHRQEHAPSDLHTLLHNALPLDEEERPAIKAQEEAFLRQRQMIEDRLRDANGRLARAIARDPTWGPEVEAATRDVERAAGELQRATLVHVFALRRDLTPAHRAAYDRAVVAALQRGAP